MSETSPPYEVPDVCGLSAELPSGETVTCGRPHQHADDHFDDRAGIWWPNAGDEATLAGMTQDERVHLALDRLGVPRFRRASEDQPPRIFTLVQRHNLFVDRLSRRLHTQVENNMIYYNAVRDALTLLRGAPNSGQLRIRNAIKKLEAVQPERKTPSGLVLQ